MLRCKYYFGWKLSMLSVHASGISYSGGEEFKRINTVNPYAVETSVHMREKIANWNIVRAARVLPQGTELEWRQGAVAAAPGAAPATPDAALERTSHDFRLEVSELMRERQISERDDRLGFLEEVRQLFVDYQRGRRIGARKK